MILGEIIAREHIPWSRKDQGRIEERLLEIGRGRTPAGVGFDGHVVNVDVFAGMSPQDAHGLLFTGRIAGADPQKQAAMIELILQVVRMLALDPERKRAADRGADAASDGGRRRGRRKRAA